MKCKNNCFNDNYKCPHLINAKGYFCVLFQNWIKDMINCDYKRNVRRTFKPLRSNR
ncbi:hypothetical protein LCGC14_0364460 [marine sediment metagenome]|uniref:Uncharacterized protein n=1 Tax=marine sediment metagenome TaxID=412755 RepID=A0A0F9TCQ1_9ZZZZ